MITNIPCEKITYCSKGNSAHEFMPGDFILVSDNSFYSRLIQFGQNLRFRGSRFNKWTHTALIVSPDGTLVESDGRGVRNSSLDKYLDKDYYLVNISALIDDRREAVVFALSCLGDEYGWLTIISIAISMLTGLKFSIGLDGQEICSGLVARSLERTSAIFPRDPSHISPSELAKYYLGTADEKQMD